VRLRHVRHASADACGGRLKAMGSKVTGTPEYVRWPKEPVQFMVPARWRGLYRHEVEQAMRAQEARREELRMDVARRAHRDQPSRIQTTLKGVKV
jgi:hypothetical protein